MPSATCSTGLEISAHLRAVQKAEALHNTPESRGSWLVPGYGVGLRVKLLSCKQRCVGSLVCKGRAAVQLASRRLPCRWNLSSHSPATKRSLQCTGGGPARPDSGSRTTRCPAQALDQPEHVLCSRLSRYQLTWLPRPPLIWTADRQPVRRCLSISANGYDVQHSRQDAGQR